MSTTNYIIMAFAFGSLITILFLGIRDAISKKNKDVKVSAPEAPYKVEQTEIVKPVQPAQPKEPVKPAVPKAPIKPKTTNKPVTPRGPVKTASVKAPAAIQAEKPKRRRRKKAVKAD